jgi:hypothetical protein
MQSAAVVGKPRVRARYKADLILIERLPAISASPVRPRQFTPPTRFIATGCRSRHQDAPVRRFTAAVVEDLQELTRLDGVPFG